MKKCLILIACVIFICSCKPDDDGYSEVQLYDSTIELLAEGYLC